MPEPDQTTIQDIRKRAVAEYDAAAAYFADQYLRLPENRFFSSFTYGRRKIDDVLAGLVSGFERGAAVLDIGCGTGDQIRLLRHLGLAAEGIEPSERMRAIATVNNPGVPIRDGSATALPYADGTFKMVLAIEVLRYLHRADVLAAYREMFRVLEPGGQAVFTMVNRFALNGFYVFDSIRRTLSRFVRVAEPIHCEFVTPRGVRYDLQTVGFADIRFFGRVIVPIRPFYALNSRLGAWVARATEPLDDWLAGRHWTLPFSARLIVAAQKPHPDRVR